MTKRRWVILVAAGLLLAGVALYSYQRGTDISATRDALLALMPADAASVLYADVADIRNSAFLSEIYVWAPQAQIDADYARFLRDTGFDYQRDLDRVAVALIQRGSEKLLFSVADGRFDRQKIETYLSQSGSRVTLDGHEIFSAPLTGRTKAISLTFLRDNRIALANSDVRPLLKQAPSAEDARQWRQRFERLAGSPVFVVLRQDAGAGGALPQAAGGWQSPQLANLLNQLSWITIAGKPEGDRLRIVAEGECLEDRTARQLTDLLNGILVMAHTGLNGPETRRQLDPKARDAYLEILRSADVARIDRGETKSVRVVLDVTPRLLEAAATLNSVHPASTPETANTGKRQATNNTKSRKSAR